MLELCLIALTFCFVATWTIFARRLRRMQAQLNNKVDKWKPYKPPESYDVPASFGYKT